MTDIVDCRIHGGHALQADCPPEGSGLNGEGADCYNSISGPASAWKPSVILEISDTTSIVSERLVATEGQTLFLLSTFAYTPDTGSLDIHKNGLLLTNGIQWTEGSGTTFVLAEGATEGDEIVATGHVGTTANVDVRDTDIYVLNHQAVRDYVGSEELLYAQGKVTKFDGAAGFWQQLTGAAPGTYVDDDSTILVPTAGDGSTGWVSNRKAYAFNTVAEMMAYPSLAVGDIVETAGYSTSLDGGGNTYFIVAAATGTDDGGSYIDLAGSGHQAKGLFPGGTFNVLQWGAVGDGTTDDSVVIQAAHDYTNLIGGGILIFPVPTTSYRCNITLKDNTELRGATPSVTIIPASDAPIFTVDSNANISNLTIDSLTLDGAATKGSFTSQTGISMEPASTFKHDAITISKCIIKDCGAEGILALGTGSLADSLRVEQLHINTCNIHDNTLPGLRLKGNTGLVTAFNTEFNDNGDMTVDLESNVVLEAYLSGFPESCAFTSCNFVTPSYVGNGNSIILHGALDVSFLSCLFADLITGIFIKDANNGNIAVRDCRFEVVGGGAIASLCEIESASGFVWDNNNVAALTTGPSGLLLNVAATGMIDNLHISSNNTWGGLTEAHTDINAIEVPVSNDISLLSHAGPVPLTLAGAGSENLENIYDKNDGIAQLVTGNIITLYTIDDTRDVVVVETGNIRLGAATRSLLTSVDTLQLMWNSRLGAWVEVSFSNNT